MSEPFVDDTPSYVQESFGMLEKVKDRLRGLVEEIDEVMGTAQTVVKYELTVIDGGEEGVQMKCLNCSKDHLERRSEDMPCYGYCSKDCFLEAHPEKS